MLKPAETTPLTALLLAEIIQEADLPPGVVNIVTGDGGAGAALVRSDVDKVAFTGSTAVGKEIQRALAGTGRGLTLELGGKSANIVFEDAALDQAVEGIIEGIFFNQGHVCCAGSRLLLQESVAEEVVRRLWARMERLRVGDPLDKNTDVGAINSAAQLDADHVAGGGGRARGRDPALDLVRAARDRLLVPADDVPRRRPGQPDRGRGDLRPGRVGDDVPHAGRGRRAGEQLAPTGWPRACGPTTAPRPSRSRASCAPAWSGRTPTTSSTRRPRSAATRRAGSGARAGRPACCRTSRWARHEPPLAGRQDVQALPGRRVRALGVRTQRPDDRRVGAHLANVPRASRKDVRDAVKVARAASGGWAKRTAYNRGQVLYRFAEALESRSDELARGPKEGRAELGAAVDLLVHYAGWTDKLAVVMGGINPVAGPHLSFSTPEPTGVVAVLAPDEPDVLGLIREVAPVLAAGNSAVVLVSRRWPLRPLDLGEVAGVSDVPGGVLTCCAGAWTSC